MAETRERNLSDQIRAWVQIIGIFLAAGLGYYQFVWKEKIAPRSAPINVSVNLGLKKILTTAGGTSDQSSSMIAVEMQVSAKNPSARKVDLLPSVWVAYGYTLGATEFSAYESFRSRANEVLKQSNGVAERGFTYTSWGVLSTGRLFTDDVLKPNEAIARTLILHIPPNKYDMLVVYCDFPSAADASKLDLEWALDSTKNMVDTWFFKDKNGNRLKQLTPDERILINEPPYEAQYAHSVSELSLR